MRPREACGYCGQPSIYEIEAYYSSFWACQSCIGRMTDDCVKNGVSILEIWNRGKGWLQG